MMSYDRELLVIIPFAAGVLLLGILGLLATRIAFSWRLACAGLATAGLHFTLAQLFEASDLLTYPLATLAGTVGLVTFTRVGAASWFVEQLRTPVGAGVAIVLVGLIGTVGAVVRHERQFEEAAAYDARGLQLLGYLPARAEVGDVHAVTDLGRPIPLSRPVAAHSAKELDEMERECLSRTNWSDSVVHCQGPSEGTNCHGWTFTGGRYMVSNAAVEMILQDNGYAVVPTAAPGDLAVYRDTHGEVIHTAVVRYVAAGRPPMVEGKWGWMGVYLHGVDQCCYGAHYDFYRSPRGGDLLHGLTGHSALAPLGGAE